MTPREGTVRFWFGYRWWKLTTYGPARLRYRLKHDLPWWIACKLPRKVALMAFVRVFGILGDCPPIYSEIYRAWEAQSVALRETTGAQSRKSRPRGSKSVDGDSQADTSRI